MPEYSIDIASLLAETADELAANPIPPARDPNAPAMTGAERAKAMRARDREAGIVRNTRSDAGQEQERQRNKRRATRAKNYDPTRSLFASGEFIAVDGEGVSEGPVQTFKSGGRCYQSQAHYMILLAASSGHEITATHGRLSTRDCLDMLLEVAHENPRSIMVCYGGSYDVNQILLHGLPVRALRNIARGKRVGVPIDGHYYRIEYRSRKCLRVSRFAGDEAPGYETYCKRDGSHDQREVKPERSFVLWDTIGFFQASFVSTMQKWLGSDHSDFAMITKMKENRSDFERSELPAMIEYNRAECRALVQIMNKLRDAIAGLGLTLSRWDGAGAVAAAMNSEWDVKMSKQEPPDDVFEAARCAFSGGHIETMKIGSFDCDVHHYDLNSAYPSIIKDLPCLLEAKWSHGFDFDPPPGFTVVKVRYEFALNMPFYPLFFRHKNGSITYPQHGCGWYWYPEFEVARDFAFQHGAKVFEVLQWHHCTPKIMSKPFEFVPLYYKKRQEMIRKLEAGELTEIDGWMSGGEYVIKLGLNSLYGKTAQQLGGRNFAPPPYFQLEWAGYITAGCRAALMRAAMQEPDAIISFATDGIFSLKPLNLDTPKEKILGAWEYKRHNGMVVAMPGVYWLYDSEKARDARIGDKPSKAFSRGFEKTAVSTPDLVMQKWMQHKTFVDIPIQRLITMGTACTSDRRDANMWRVRGRFVRGKRRLDISGDSVKRTSPRYKKRAPELWREGAATYPRPNAVYIEQQLSGIEPDSSAPYVIKWMAGDGYEAAEDLDLSREEMREMMDADDEMW